MTPTRRPNNLWTTSSPTCGQPSVTAKLGGTPVPPEGGTPFPPDPNLGGTPVPPEGGTPFPPLVRSRLEEQLKRGTDTRKHITSQPNHQKRARPCAQQLPRTLRALATEPPLPPPITPPIFPQAFKNSAQRLAPQRHTPNNRQPTTPRPTLPTMGTHAEHDNGDNGAHNSKPSSTKAAPTAGDATPPSPHTNPTPGSSATPATKPAAAPSPKHSPNANPATAEPAANSEPNDDGNPNHSPAEHSDPPPAGITQTGTTGTSTGPHLRFNHSRANRIRKSSRAK